jgi:hypothetical protein
MTKDDRNEVRELLNDIISAPLEKIDGQYRLMTNQLANIETQTLKTNNRVTHLEGDLVGLETKVDNAIAEAHHAIDTRATECPNVARISNIEDTVDNLKTWKSKEEGLEQHSRFKFDSFIKVAGILLTLFLALMAYINLSRTQKDMQWDMRLIKAGMPIAPRGMNIDTLQYEDTTNQN